MGEFGDKFRKAREKKGISLEDVSNVTKISSRNLQAIEEEHFDQLPGGVFNKGFIRAYAKHIGLNDEQAVNEYLACLRQAQIDAQAVWEPQDRAATPPKRPVIVANHAVDARVAAHSRAGDPAAPAQVEELPELHLPRAEHVRPPRRQYSLKDDSRIPLRLVAAAVLLAVLGVFLWQRHVRGAHAQGAAVPAPSAAPPQSSPAQVLAPSATVPVAATVDAGISSKSSGPKTPKPQPTATITKPSAATTPAGAAASVSANPAANTPERDPNPALSIAANASIPPPAPAAMTLVIRATENSWVSVTADGQVVSQETLIAPAHTSVHANREIVAKIGNAAGVTFLWNGQEIPVEGQESEVKTFVFDASGMHVAPAVSPAPTQSR